MIRVLRVARAAATALAIAATAPMAALVAQDAPPLNGKQRLLATGQLTPLQLARLAERRAAADTFALPAGAPRVPQFAPGQLIVKLSEDAAPARLSALAARAGAWRVTGSRYGAFSILHVDPSADLHALALEISREPGVAYAEPAAILQPAFRPNDPLYELQWNLAKLDMERVWDINRGGNTSVVVAVIDTGVAFSDEEGFVKAPDLAGGTFVAPFDFIWDDDLPVDLDGHGTHVTGTVAQTTNNDEGVAGFAFNVAVMPIKAISGEIDEVLGAPNVGTTATLADAIRYAADNGAKVINLSLGASFGGNTLREAIEYAVGKGVVIAAAAGNDGDAGSPPFYPAAYAAEIDGLIAVAAVDFNLERAFYSNSNDYVEIAAPGGDTGVDLNFDGYADGVLQQTLDEDAILDEGRFDVFTYQFNQGTSMASPHVAALAALLVDQGITSPAAVEAAIERFATDLGPDGRDNDTGHGLINPRATLRGLGLAR